MRLEQVFIDGFKNLNQLEVEFDTGRMTTVIIGQNGSGKSNLVEAITEVFRYFDLKRNPPRYRFKIVYRIGDHRVQLSNWADTAPILVDDLPCNSAEFDRRKHELFPDLIFGYYSGGSQRLERLFDTHQRRYYDAIKRNDDPQECRDARRDRRLFYCRPIHGIFALLSFFAFSDPKVASLLQEKLGIVGFHSALAHFREPWFAKGGKTVKASKATELWDASGPAGECARRLRDHAFHPFALVGSAVDDYRDKNQTEAQFAAFLRDGKALEAFASLYDGDQSMFNALEAADISDLFRDFHVWVTRKNDMSGDVSFGDLSDGERQLLMALGLIRISRGKQALFLLDEPDTHLNPHWQLSYLDLIKEWTGIAADADACQIVLTSHNPLTISALEKEDVRILFQEDDGRMGPSRYCISSSNKIRVEKTAKYLGLDLPALKEARLAVMRDIRFLVEDLCQLMIAATDNESVAEALPLENKLVNLEEKMHPSQPYVAAARAELRRQGYAELCVQPEEVGT